MAHVNNLWGYKSKEGPLRIERVKNQFKTEKKDVFRFSRTFFLFDTLGLLVIAIKDPTSNSQNIPDTRKHC